MKKIFLPLFALLFFFSCSIDYVARVGAKKITPETFKVKMLDVPFYYRGFLETPEGRRQYLEGLVNELVLVELAKEKGIHRRPEVKERIESVVQSLLIEEILQELQNDQLKVTDDEIDKYWEKNKDLFLSPSSVRVAHILVGSESEARELRRRLEEGESFALIAKNFSLDKESAKTGGDLGYFGKGEMVPEFEEAAFALEQEGEISKPIKTAFGWHIIKLIDKKAAEPKTKEEARDEIVQQIQKEKLENLLEYYRKKFDVKMNYDSIASIIPPWQTEEEKE